MTRAPEWLPADLTLLDQRCPLPLDRPFTPQQALQLGVSRWYLQVVLERGLVRPLVRGVYAVAQLASSIEQRAEALCRSVPDGAVVTDRTAAWLYGMDVLHRSAVHEIPTVQMFGRSYRLR